MPSTCGHVLPLLLLGRGHAEDDREEACNVPHVDLSGFSIVVSEGLVVGGHTVHHGLRVLEETLRTNHGAIFQRRTQCHRRFTPSILRSSDYPRRTSC